LFASFFVCIKINKTPNRQSGFDGLGGY